MKQTLIFLLLFVCALAVDLKPVSIASLQPSVMEVTVEGAVESPGTIQLPLYASMEDALQKTGVQEDADMDAINPMTILKDKDHIVIPSRTEEGMQRISINTAPRERLIQIPGVGESIADRIIAYREENGLFQEIEDIMHVKGIGQTKFEKMKDYIGL